MITFDENQERIISNALEMIRSNDKDLYELSGIAGSGKSTILMEIIKRSGCKNVMGCAITGQAVSVLQSKGIEAKTIHSLIYDSYMGKSDKMNEYLDMPKSKLNFRKKRILNNVDLLLIDEAYMINEEIANDLKSFIGIKKIACGDFYQLPPVKGKPGFLTNPNVDRLLTPFRQNNTSGIYLLANDILNDNNKYEDFVDVKFKKFDDITDEDILNHDVILCCTNKMKEYFNLKCREIRGINSVLPVHGDRVVFKKNNHRIRIDGISLVNGMSGTVLGEVMKYNNSSFDIHFKPDFGNEIKKITCDYRYFTADSKDKLFLRSNSKYSNGEYLEFGYAATVHSYQGSQSKRCMYIDESHLFKDCKKAIQYTAVTRASEFLTWVIV